MDYVTFRATVEAMISEEREIAVLLYMKDIKDLLQTLLESKGIEPKHY